MNVLFAGYYPHESKILQPVVVKLVKAGHGVAFLAAPDTQRSYMTTAHLFRGLPGMAPQYVAERIFGEWQPDIVVLSPKGRSSLEIRAVAHDWGVPCLYWLPPYVEFKDPESIVIAPDRTTPPEQHLVCSPVGLSILMAKGVLAPMITITGSPSWDWMVGWDHKSPDQFTVLFADQATPACTDLGRALMRYLGPRKDCKLIMRMHPGDQRSDRGAWQREIEYYNLEDRVTIGKSLATLGDDLQHASVLVSGPSLTLCEARMVNMPAVAYGDQVPKSIRDWGTGELFRATNVGSLYTQLDFVKQQIVTKLLPEALKPQDSKFTRATDQIAHIIWQIVQSRK